MSRWSVAGWSTSSGVPVSLGRRGASLTTNALGLARTASALREAGLDQVNVSLDTIRRETFHEITRRDRLADVVAGPRTAARRRASAR